MSTYTDLHNKVKETLNVDYCSRDSFQEVHLKNPRNIYHGTLKGTLQADDIAVEGGTIKNVTLMDSALSGKVILPGGTDLAKIGYTLQQLSSDLYVTVIDEKIPELHKELDEEMSARISADVYNAGRINSLSADLRREISATIKLLTKQDSDISSFLSNEIKDVNERLDQEIQDRIDADEIIELNLGKEILDRVQADSILNDKIDAVSAESDSRDNKLTEDLRFHALDNERTFSSLSATVDLKVEHDRHYEINGGKQAIAGYPYKAKDYAINVFDVQLIDGRVYHEDYLTKEKYDIGQIIKDSSNHLYPFTFTTYSDFQDESIESVLIPTTPYQITDSQRSVTFNVLNGYTLNYTQKPDTTQLSDGYFTLVPSYPTYHALTYGGRIIGKAFDTLPEGKNADIDSGRIQIDNADGELVVFNGFETSFNKSDLSSISKNNERIVYLGKNKFRFDKNITAANYIGVYDIIAPEHTQFIRIFDNDNGISGIISADGEITEINTTLTDYDTKRVSLKRENGFRTIVNHNILIGNAYNDLTLSADVDDLSASFELVNVRELYKYSIFGANDDGDIVEVGTVTPVLYNKDIKTTSDYSEVSVDLTQINWINEFKNIYVLTKPTTSEIWSCEAHDTDGNVLNVKYNGIELYVKVTSSTSGQIVRQKYTIDIDNPVIANPDDCHETIYKSDLTDLSEYDQVSETYTSFNISMAEGEDEYSATSETYELKIDSSANQILKIQMPEKSFTDISREFYIVFRANGNSEFVELDFVDKNGNDVKIFNHRSEKLYIKTNQWTTLQINEISPNTYLITDLDHNIDDARLRWLKDTLCAEIDLRNNQYTFLSNSISTNIDDIYDLSCDLSSLSNEVSAISSNFEKRISKNESDIVTIFERIKGGVYYKGIVKLPFAEDQTLSGIIAKRYFDALTDEEKQELGIRHHNDAAIISANLSAGWFYNVSAENDYTHYIVSGVEIENRDTLVLNTSKAISAITSNDIDVVDAMDSDTFRLSADNYIIGTNTFDGLQKISNAQITNLSATNLSVKTADITDLSVENLSATNISVENLSATNLSVETADITELSVKTADITDLSVETVDITDLSVENLSATNLSVEIADITDLSVENLSATNLSVETADITDLSVETADITDLSVETADITDLSVENLSATNLSVKTADITDLSVENLSATNLSVETADITELSVENLSATNLSVETADITKLSVETADITDLSVETADITDLSVENLSATNLSVKTADITDLSVETADITDLSVEYLSADKSDIANLSGLSVSIQNLSVDSLSKIKILDKSIYHEDDSHEPILTYISSVQDVLDLCVTVLNNQILSNDSDIIYLSNEICSNNSDISVISNDLSTLEDHYYKTMSCDIELTHKTEGITYNKIVDKLLIIDEITFDLYALTIRNGALNINKISNIIES